MSAQADYFEELLATRAELEHVKQERDDALANADFWERELNNFRRNAAHRAEQLAKEKIEAAESENKRLREALVAARDVIAALQKQLGVVPGQNGYSATMTAGEIQAAKAVQDLDEIIAALRGE